MLLPRIIGLPVELFVGAVITLLFAHYYNVLPSGLPGALGICLVLGALLGEIGNRLPIWNKYIGGGPVMVFLGTAGLVYMGWLTDHEVETITGLVKDSQFVDLFIAVLVFGNILAIEKSILLRSLVGYVPTILLAVAGAAVMGVLAGFVVGVSPQDIIMLYVLPIMGGGCGAGAIPLSEIYETATGQPRETYYSKAVSILTIANVLSILAASFLNHLGKKFPAISGDGNLVRGEKKQTTDVDAQRGYQVIDLVGGLTLAVVFYVLAELFAKVFFDNVQIHRYAWLVVLVAVLNISGVVPLSLRCGARRVADFFSGELLWILMVGIGVVYTSLEDIIAAISPATVLVSAVIVLGAILGGAFGGRIFGFYEIESAISAGLCMANRGGTGDIEVLAAANRMKLLSYAQISSRLGGGMVLTFGAVFFSMYG